MRRPACRPFQPPSFSLLAAVRTPLKANLEPILQGYGEPPSLGCPRTPSLSVVLSEGAEENDTLILVLTDGEPTDCSFNDLGRFIRRKRQNVYISFAMCTDEDDVVDLYNEAIDPLPGCDITDDFVSEKKEAQRFGNVLTPYSWLAKMLLVKFDKYDKLDERRVKGFKKGKGGCCVVA